MFASPEILATIITLVVSPFIAFYFYRQSKKEEEEAKRDVEEYRKKEEKEEEEDRKMIAQRREMLAKRASEPYPIPTERNFYDVLINILDLLQAKEDLDVQIEYVDFISDNFGFMFLENWEYADSFCAPEIRQNPLWKWEKLAAFLNEASTYRPPTRGKYFTEYHPYLFQSMKPAVRQTLHRIFNGGTFIPLK
jgi:hypothetical protein